MNRLRIGVVGTNFGKWVIEQIANGEGSAWLELAAICDLDAVKAQALADQYGVKAYADLTALLADASIPAIALITEPVGRAQLIARIIAAGKDVLTTKPFERDAGAALQVLREAQRLERVVHVNSPGPVPPPDIALIRQWQQQHQLGAPIAARIETWVSYREQANGSWYDDPRLCPVPPIFRLGIYLINDLIALLGEAQKVTVLESRRFTGRPTSDNGQLGILFKSGALANVFASFCVGDGDRYRNGLILNFERGTIYRNIGPQRSLTENDLSLIMKVDDQRQCVEQVKLPQSSGGYQWENFYRAVHGEKLAGAVSPEQIVAGLTVIEAMARAAESGGVAEVRQMDKESGRGATDRMRQET